MPQSTAQLYLGLGGINVNGAYVRTGAGQFSEQVTPDVLAAGQAGSLTTRTSDTAGVVTLSATPSGITTSTKLSVCWAGGSRINMTVSSVVGNAVTVTGGTGDVLPAASTAVVVDVVINVGLSFAGDSLQIIAAVSTVDLAVGFYSSADALLLQLKLKGGNPQGEPWFWAANAGIANPLAGASVAYMLIGNGGTNAGTFSMSGLRT